MSGVVLTLAVGVLVAASILIGMQVALPRHDCYGGRAPRGIELVCVAVVVLAADAVVGWVA
jgi:hypothetical protein